MLWIKKCKNCMVEKLVSEFRFNWYSRNWKKVYKPYCSYCYNLMGRNDRIINGDEIRRKRREYESKNREKIRNYKREAYAKMTPEQKKYIQRRNRKWRNRNKLIWKRRWIRIQVIRILENKIPRKYEKRQSWVNTKLIQKNILKKNILCWKWLSKDIYGVW